MPLDGTGYQPAPLNETARILQRAAEILEKGWCKQARGRDAGGARVSSLDPRAVGRCALGAIDVAAAELGLPLTEWQCNGVTYRICNHQPWMAPVARALGFQVPEWIAIWNNASDQAEVVAGFRRAVQLANEEALAGAQA